MSALPPEADIRGARRHVCFGAISGNCPLGRQAQQRSDLSEFDQVSPVGTIAAVSTIKITLLSGARVQCNTPFGTVKP
jgi:hypothetical protein